MSLYNFFPHGKILFFILFLFSNSVFAFEIRAKKDEKFVLISKKRPLFVICSPSNSIVFSQNDINSKDYFFIDGVLNKSINGPVECEILLENDHRSRFLVNQSLFFHDLITDLEDQEERIFENDFFSRLNLYFAKKLFLKNLDSKIKLNNKNLSFFSKKITKSNFEFFIEFSLKNTSKNKIEIDFFEDDNTKAIIFYDENFTKIDAEEEKEGLLVLKNLDLGEDFFKEKL